MNTGKMALWAKIASVFSPGAPIDKASLFAGRSEQLQNVINTISQRGQHVIIFGERGVGKTSLVNVLTEIMASAGLTIQSTTVNCDTSDNFISLWHKIFRELTIETPSRTIGLVEQSAFEAVSLNQYLTENVRPEDVRYILQNLISRSIIVIDEIDRIHDKYTTTLLADTIKSLSDHSVNATLVLVGVANSVTELIAEHASIERSLVQIRMPRMSMDELFEIIDKGIKQVDMMIDDNVKDRIAKLSQGLPHYTHLLALHAAQNAVETDNVNVTMRDLDNAIKIAVDRAQQSILDVYHKATSSAKKASLYSQVLLACALADTDDLGSFAAADVRRPMKLVTGKDYDIPAFARHLYNFCDQARGPVLQTTGQSRRLRYRFVNPMMQPFVIMNGIAKRLVKSSSL